MVEDNRSLRSYGYLSALLIEEAIKMANGTSLQVVYVGGVRKWRTSSCCPFQQFKLFNVPILCVKFQLRN